VTVLFSTNINDYSLYGDPRMNANTQTRTVSSPPDMSEGLLPYTTRPRRHYLGSPNSHHGVALHTPHSNSIHTRTTQNRPTHTFLGAFGKLRRAAVGFVVSLRVSVCPHGTTRLLLDGFSLNFIFEYFSKNCRDNSSFFIIGQELRVLYMKTDTRFESYLAQFFLE
jgi:hypothetical protein